MELCSVMELIIQGLMYISWKHYSIAAEMQEFINNIKFIFT